MAGCLGLRISMVRLEPTQAARQGLRTARMQILSRQHSHACCKAITAWQATTHEALPCQDNKALPPAQASPGGTGP